VTNLELATRFPKLESISKPIIPLRLRTDY
jgi:hypothetical protein